MNGRLESTVTPLLRATLMRTRLRSVVPCAIGVALALMVFAGCTAPIGARRVTTRQAYEQVDASALRTGKPSAYTVSILHRYGLDRLAASRPHEAVRQLHQRALATDERGLLFALSELSYVAGDHFRLSVKPGEVPNARDYYLGSAVYAWLFLFGNVTEPPPGAFDRRFREACDLYNYSLGLAFLDPKGTNGAVQLLSSARRLPVDEIDVTLTNLYPTLRLDQVEQILLADKYRVRGLSMRNREAGVGAPILCIERMDTAIDIRKSMPATLLLRGPASLAEMSGARRTYSLELYSAYGNNTVTVGSAQVPLEIDLTAFRAYTLSQSRIWKLGKLNFLAPAERIPSQLLMNQPFEPDRIPLVLVHGTFSSPVTWAEMANSLIADPQLRQRYQIWTFVYGSGNPLVYSVAEFRAALTAKVQELDPAGTNAALRQMVIVGHSQGGLLTKSAAVDTGDRLWQNFSTSRLEDLMVSDAQKEKLRRMLFLTPLPFVKRVIFIATPHRGSYLASGFARRLAQRFVSLPGAMVSRSSDMLKFTAESEAGRFWRGRLPTSLDGMSPKNPGLLAMAEISVVPSVKAHSIIPVLDKDDYHKGRDGVVSYQSAHIDYAQSEFIVRSGHCCLDDPATIEEVRRILSEHLRDLK
jgi:pimeloyl-ACP methyl ester carboxylesterase